jgi:hypothetical protein
VDQNKVRKMEMKMSNNLNQGRFTGHKQKPMKKNLAFYTDPAHSGFTAFCVSIPCPGDEG